MAFFFRFVRLQLLQGRPTESVPTTGVPNATMLHVINFSGKGKQLHRSSTSSGPATLDEGQEHGTDERGWATRGPLAILCALLSGLSSAAENTRIHHNKRPGTSPFKDSVAQNIRWPPYLHHPRCPQAQQQPPLPPLLKNLQQQLLGQEGQTVLFHLLVPMLLAHSRTFALCCLWKATQRPRRLAAFLTCMQRAMHHAPVCKPPQRSKSVSSGLCMRSHTRISPIPSPGSYGENVQVRHCHSPAIQINDGGFAALKDEPPSSTKCTLPSVTSPKPVSTSGESIRSCRMLQSARRTRTKQRRQQQYRNIAALLNAFGKSRKKRRTNIFQRLTPVLSTASESHVSCTKEINAHSRRCLAHPILREHRCTMKHVQS